MHATTVRDPKPLVMHVAQLHGTCLGFEALAIVVSGERRSPLTQCVPAVGAHSQCLTGQCCLCTCTALVCAVDCVVQVVYKSGEQ